MNWQTLSAIDQLHQIDELSKTKNILIFKHSTRCSISDAALNRVERNWKAEDETSLMPFYLDLLKHRDVSNAIAQHYQIEHQSPQALIIKNGKCIFSQTHSAIRLEELLKAQ
jgi:bacillithiol system protein YtxJ